jgi:hypothetical protein
MARGTFTNPIEDQLARKQQTERKTEASLNCKPKKEELPSLRIEPSVSRSFNPYDRRSNHWATPTYYNLVIIKIYLN